PLAQLAGEPVDIDARQELLDRLGAHAGLEAASGPLPQLPVPRLVQDLALLALRAVSRIDHAVGLEVEDALQVAERHVEQVADAAREPLEEPDVADRARQLDVAHALAAHLA